MSNAAHLLEIARERHLRIATAESCTGGMIAAALTDIPGSSDVIEAGLITYSNAAKETLLGVAHATLEAHGAVSEEVAAEMAAGALIRTGADLAVSVTGIAGPGGSEFKPEGRVCFGLACKNRPAHTETVDFGALGRTAVRKASVDHAIALLTRAIPES